MRSFVQRLIAEERRSAGPSASASRAAFRACDKLRQPLSTFAGAAGFRSLLARALVLAKTKTPLLAGVELKSDGTFEFSPEMEAQLATEEAVKAAAILVEELLGLLFIFIGEALTLRLVHDVWPEAALKNSKVEGK